MAWRRGSATAAFATGALLACGCTLLVSTSGLSDGDGAGPDAAAAAAAADAGPTAEGGAGDGGADAAGRSVQLSASLAHSCAVVDGVAYCWGANDLGQLGDGTKTDRPTPVRVRGLPTGAVTAIGAGHGHTCAVVAGQVHCWGANLFGEIGVNPNGGSVTPVLVSGLSAPATGVQCGGGFSCAHVGASVNCWGANSVGRLGDGTTTPHATPSVVVGESGPLTNVAQLSVGGDHACILTSAGDPMCWGHSDNGALGNAAAGDFSSVAVPVLGLPGKAALVTIGSFHACAVMTSGPVYCWGTGDSGELGNGATSSSVDPVPVTGLTSGVTYIEAVGGPLAGDSTCAVQGGAVSCWGNGSNFRLGDGQTGPRSTPVRMTTLPASVKVLAGGGTHWCTHLANDEIRCWGGGTRGQLGDGASIDRALPVLVTIPP